MTLKTAFAALTFALLSLSPAQAQDFGPLLGEAYGDGTSAIVAVAHGDVSRGGPVTYHFALARSIAGGSDAVAVALLRPGYTDGLVTSPGTNHERWDQYTSENNDLLAETLANLKETYPNRALIAVGHSGGAAQLGAIIGRYPGLVDTAVLVSCPCHFVDWRSRYNRQLIRSADQSPEMHIAGIDPATRIIAITGADDDNTYPGLAEDYVAAAQARGLNAEVIIVPDVAHWGPPLVTTLVNTVIAEVPE